MGSRVFGVMAKYMHNQNEVEEYIDLVPILEDLYYDADEFLAPIKKVRIEYNWWKYIINSAWKHSIEDMITLKKKR